MKESDSGHESPSISSAEEKASSKLIKTVSIENEVGHKLPSDIPAREKTVLDAELARNLAAARLQGKKIGLVQGSYDLFHLGHLRYLLKAKSLCDFLVVALDSDEKNTKAQGKWTPNYS